MDWFIHDFIPGLLTMGVLVAIAGWVHIDEKIQRLKSECKQLETTLLDFSGQIIDHETDQLDGSNSTISKIDRLKIIERASDILCMWGKRSSYSHILEASRKALKESENIKES